MFTTVIVFFKLQIRVFSVAFEMSFIKFCFMIINFNFSVFVNYKNIFQLSEKLSLPVVFKLENNYIL